VKTLTVAEGRRSLGQILRRALSGDDIGIVIDGAIVGLRPVEVISTDYALREYGLTAKEVAQAEKRIRAQITKERKRGEVTRFTGTDESQKSKGRSQRAAWVENENQFGKGSCRLSEGVWLGHAHL